MQLQFKYNGKEISKENFNKLNDVFKWVTNSTVNLVDFDSIFDGKYKSMREINGHIKSLGLLPLEQSKSDYKKVLEKTLEEDLRKQFTKQVDIVVNLNDEYINNYLQTHKDKSRVFNDGLFSRINSAEKNKKEDLNFTTIENQTLTNKKQNHLSTRHKSQTYNEEKSDFMKESKEVMDELYKNGNRSMNGLFVETIKTMIDREYSKNSIKETKTEENNSCNWEMCGQIECHNCYPNKDSKITKEALNRYKESEEKDNMINKEELPPYQELDLSELLKSWKEHIVGDYRKDEEDKWVALKDFFKKPTGVKHNQHKLPMSKLFIQFPDALQAIVLASCYGHHCYPTDTDWLNFKRVEGGSENYRDASIRHLLGGEKDKESNLPEIFHQAWNKLAELQLWLEENSIDIKEFSNNYLKNLQDKK